MNFRLLVTTVAAAALAAGLASCGTLARGDDTAAQDLFAKVLADSSCAHDDKISVITGAGGLPASVQASAERHCPGPREAAAPSAAR